MKQKTKNFLLLAAIAGLYLFLLYIFVSSYAFDDLGFDFSGYALRYKFAFSGWIENLLFGVPAATFDGFVPALLPLLLKALGVGSFTLPVTASIFLLQLAVPLAFILIGRIFGIGRKESVLIGLLFVLNPFSFKFFNRYFEFTAWFFFLFSFYFFYRFLGEKKFSKKYFALSVLASVAIVLSHPVGMYFWAIALALSLAGVGDLKRFLAVALLTAGITAFWLLPFFSFSSLSVVSAQKGAELSTTGIRAASYFFAVALPAILVIFRRQLGKNPRVFRLFLGASLLAIVYAVAPWLPLLNIPFAHSFHAFSAFALAVALMQLLKTGSLKKKHFLAAGAVAAACLVILFPVIARQYFFTEPRYANYEFEKQRIDFNEIDALLRQIPKTARFETLPYDPIVSAYSSFNYDLLSLRGWGYNTYAMKESYALGEKLTSLAIPCGEFVSGSEKAAVQYWIALNARGESFLKTCGLKKISGNLPALYFLESSNAGLVDGAELLEFESNYIRLRAESREILVKESWFPRWSAASDGKEIGIEDAKPGMQLQAEPGAIVELRYGLSKTDFLGIAISIAALVLFAFALR